MKIEKKVLEVADLFCGAGGTSTGAKEAIESLGYECRLTAVNHWDRAIETHTANHPDARHLCASLDSLNPRDYYREGQLDILIASPECMSHSVARGGRPINDQSRATAWCVLRWLDALLPWGVVIENVPEFQGWAPIGSNGRPMKSRKGEVFEQWKNSIRSLGYKIENRIILCANNGDPTTRRRLFIMAVRGRRKIVWPEPTHTGDTSPTFFGQLKPWVPAREIIDWSVKGTPISKRKKPLSAKTMERVREGWEKFGWKPFIIPNFGERDGQTPRTHPIDEPIPTTTQRGAGNLVEPFLVEMRGTSDCHVANSARSIDEPIPTVTGGGVHTYLVDPFLVCLEHGGNVRDIDRPMPTVTTAKGGAIAVCQPFLVGAGGPNGSGQPALIDDPLGTVLTDNRRALIQPFLVQASHGNGEDAKGNSRRVKSVDEPVPAVCGNRGDWYVCEPFILPQNSSNAPRPVSSPAPTLTSTSRGVALLQPFIIEYYGEGGASSIENPLSTVTTKDRFGLVLPVIEVHGKRFVVDFLYRMLQPKELAGAQGFRSDYKFAGTKTEIVKQIGNAVPRRTARALVAAMVSQNADVSAVYEDSERRAA